MGQGRSRPERSETSPQVTLNTTAGNVDWLEERLLMPLSARGLGEQCGHLHQDLEAPDGLWSCGWGELGPDQT